MIEKLKFKIPEEETKEFEEVFDIGEKLEKSLNSLEESKDQNKERLIKNIKNYYRVYHSIENMKKRRGVGNFGAEDFEESDRKRKIYHDGIISSLAELSKNNESSSYFNDLLTKNREEIGIWALKCAKYFNLREKKEAA